MLRTTETGAQYVALPQMIRHVRLNEWSLIVMDADRCQTAGQAEESRVKALERMRKFEEIEE
jgi:hypothetical protein